VALNILRKQRFREQWAQENRTESEEQASNADEPDAKLRRHRVIARLEQAIDALPAVYRTTLLLRTRDHLSYGEIAEATGVSLGTVMSRLNRARKKLRTMMGNLLDDLYS
jgi:RNA polymerase sigma-70 factor (ECF subfamily)